MILVLDLPMHPIQKCCLYAVNHSKVIGSREICSACEWAQRNLCHHLLAHTQEITLKINFTCKMRQRLFFR